MIHHLLLNEIEIFKKETAISPNKICPKRYLIKYELIVSHQGGNDDNKNDNANVFINNSYESSYYNSGHDQKRESQT